MQFKIMKLNSKFFYVALASMAMAGCGDDWNEDKLDGFTKPSVTQVETLEYTLTDADYKTIATNSTNKSMAEAAGVAAELSKLTSNKYFSGEIIASKYLPAFLAANYYNFDNGSSIKVTSNVLVGEPEYLAPFNSAKVVAIDEEGYDAVWGDKVKAYFLTPKTESEIAKTLLPTALPEAASGDMALVEYAYSDVEPSIGGGSSEVAEPTWTEVQPILRAAGGSWDYINVGGVDLSAYKGQTIRIGFRYNSAADNAPTWEIKNLKVLSVPYLDVFLFAKQADGSFAKVNKSSGFTGAGEYVIVSLGMDGKYYPFGTLKEGATNGYMYPEALTIENGTIAADVAAKWVITVAASAGGYTLQNASGQYLYKELIDAEAGTSKDNFMVAETVGESGYEWTIENQGSDLFVISNVLAKKSVKLNYYNGSYSYGCYADSKVEGNTYLASSLTGGETGDFTTYDKEIDGLTYVWSNDTKYGWKASAYVSGAGHAVESFIVSPAITIADNAKLPYLLFDEAINKGGSNPQSCLTVCVSTDYVEPATTAASTRSVKGNKSALYQFDGTSWSAAKVAEGTLAVMQPADYSSLGASYVSNPANVLPTYVANNYPYAVKDDVVVVAYRSSSSALSAKELVYDGTAWTITSDVSTQVDQFVKAEGVWKWDPSVTITLPAGKNQPLSTLFFQAATDWVWENVDVPAGCTAKGQGYVTSYGNNEYYCGCSAYQGNVDWRKSAAISNKPGEYDDMSDDEFNALVQQRFIEVMGHVLEAVYPSAQPVAGVKVLYTINFAVYTGVTTNWTIQYELTGTGKFTYVDKSLMKVE